ncbi:hypothetical protein AAGS40_27185 (plasmid) [Paraburkholderia sp. PREW-6R]|uniref:hypothetical protein n=1 Tax=Paraburkholderia sp. PREW-6R TaxID=3141544 RepID=UPI0031F5CF06
MATEELHAGQAEGKLELRLPAKIGAGLFALWGILHLWVGFEGFHQYLVSPAHGQWKMFIGGSNAPFSAFVFPTDPTTAHVHTNLILNFCIDVAGYGVLGIFVSWLLFKRASWLAYFMGVVLVGIADVSFTFLQMTSGIIALNFPTVSGPVIWLLAALIVPFGMPSLSNSTEN